MTDQEILEKYSEKIDLAINGLDECIAAAFKQGFIEGFRIGIAEGKIEIARNLLASNIDVTLIAQATGLPIEEIEGLKHRN